MAIHNINPGTNLLMLVIVLVQCKHMIYKREFCSYVFIKVNGLHTIELNGNAQLNGNELVQEQSRQQETSVCSGWVSHKFRILQKKRI